MSETLNHGVGVLAAPQSFFCYHQRVVQLVIWPLIMMLGVAVLNLIDQYLITYRRWTQMFHGNPVSFAFLLLLSKGTRGGGGGGGGVRVLP